jgi:adenylosuccinate synthase
LRGSGANPWDEYGTTTGRPRRVGWLDLVLLRYAVMVNGATELFLTKMDILSGFDEIKVCTTYQFQNQKIDTLDQPGISTRLDQCKPGYESLPGWNDDLRMLRKWKDLPLQAVGYIRRIEDTCGIPVTAISVGPERNAVIWKE